MDPQLNTSRYTAHFFVTGNPMDSSAREVPESSLSSIPILWISSPGLRREMESLAAERDPELRAEGLLGAAQRQEAAGRTEEALELYAAVLREARAVGADRGGSLRVRAQAGLDAILGRGAMGPRAEFLLRHLARQASDPTMLFAMGAAGAVFRMTRLAMLSRLASTANPGIMTQLLGAGRIASLGAFTLEAPTFTLASRLGNEFLGRRQDWTGAAVGRDLASSYLVLGGLKLAGWGADSVYRGLAPAAGATAARPLRTLFQQMGMLGGIQLGHSLEEGLGLCPHRDGATTLLDSLATLVQFNVAGRLTRHAFGPRFAAWERGLDLQAELFSRTVEPNPIGSPTGHLWPIAWAGVRRTLGQGRSSDGPLFPHILQMSAEGPPRGKGEDSLRTLPFIEPQGRGPSPLEINHPMQLGRRILDPSLKFEEQLQRGDIVFQITSRVFDVEPYLPSLLGHLNRLLQGQGGSIPIGRKVILNLSGERGETDGRIILLRGVRGFERFSEPQTVATSLPPSRRAAAYAPTLLAIPIETIVGQAPVVPSKPLRPLPWIAAGTEEIPSLLRRLAESVPPGERKAPALILEDLNWTDTELNASTRGMGREFPPELNFEIYLPVSETTVQGIVLGENVHWLNQFRVNLEWKRLEGRAPKDPLVVDSVEQLYQQIYFFGRLDAATAPAERTLRLSASLPEGSLSEFVRRTLNKYRVPGSRLRLEFESGAEAVNFLGLSGNWILAMDPKREIL